MHNSVNIKTSKIYTQCAWSCL